MNTIKSYNEFLLLEMKTEKEIVQDLARHLAFDRDVIKYLNTSRSKRKIGWRELLDYKLRGKQKDYINYITKNMVADYNPRITGYIKIDDGEDEAGIRLLAIIKKMKIVNVYVNVSRWYGGILLHQDRFKRICDSAKFLLKDNEDLFDKC